MPVTSKSLRGVTELTLIADIKPGLVNVPEPVAYSGRLKQLLALLFTLRQLNVEQQGTVPQTGALERLRTLHFFNWSLFDHDRRLLLTVAFDGPWEPYIRQIVELAGPLLDVIFCHCTGYEGNGCIDGYPKFSQWVRDRQVEASLMYTAAPDLTVDDRRYLQHFEREATNGKTTAPGQRPQVVRAPDPNDRLSANAEAFIKTLTVLFPLRRLFPNAEQPGSRNDLQLFDRAVELFTRHLRPTAIEALPWPNAALRTWSLSLSRSEKRAKRPAPQLDAAERLQGNILEPYRYGEHEPTHGCLVFVRFDGAAAARDFLRGIRGRLATHGSSVAGTRINLALSSRGLESSKASPAVLAALPKEFKEGMERRAGLLGDVGSNHPSKWERLRRNWPEPSGTDTVELSSIDAMLTLQAYRAESTEDDHEWTEAHPLFSEVTEIDRAPYARGVQILHVQPLRRHERSHFGLVDGLSQPAPRRSAEDTSRDAVSLGELVLGYPNDREESSPLPEQLAKNSTFLVIRKMSQNVSAFEQVSLGSPVFKAKMLGRHPDGRPLLPSESSNDFDYQQDPEGRTCPLFSHVRRANPREDKPGVDGALPGPRILRRGFPYGPVVEAAAIVAPEDDAGNRGLVFMAYCTSIADQFEAIQRWVNAGNSTNGLSAHPDLVAGTFPEGDARTQAFFDGDELRRLTLPSRPTVRLCWGLYLFVPSLDAIDELAQPLDSKPSRDVAEGLREPPALVHLRSVEREHPEKALDEWRRFLEDSSLRADALAIWRYVREHGGALRTAYGVLVGGRHEVNAVLAEGQDFSVREYHRRMEQTFGGHYLGMDLEPKRVCPAGSRAAGEALPPPPPDRYLKDSRVPNELLSKIGYTETFAFAHELTLKWFAAKKGKAFLPELATHVVSRVAGKHFGLPDFGALMNADPDPGQPLDLNAPPRVDELPPARCPADFINAGQYIFRPNPSETLAAAGARRGRVILEAADKFIQGRGPEGTLLEALQKDPRFDGNLNAAIVGAVNGYCVPTSGSFLGIMAAWIDADEIGRLRQWYSSLSDAERKAIAVADDLPDCDNPLVHAMLRAFVQRPIPDLLHRTAVSNTRVGNVQDIEPGERVVISLASAALAAYEDDGGRGDYWTVLFGGDYRQSKRPLHSCPGQKMALGTLLGIICAILPQSHLRAMPTLRLTLEYDPDRADDLAAEVRPCPRCH